MPPKQVLRNEQRLGSRVIRRTGRFNPDALAINSSVDEAGLSVPDALLRLRNSADWHLPSMPTRDQLLTEAQAMFATDPANLDILAKSRRDFSQQDKHDRENKFKDAHGRTQSCMSSANEH